VRALVEYCKAEARALLEQNIPQDGLSLPPPPGALGPFLWAGRKAACTGTVGVPTQGCIRGVGFAAILPLSKSSNVSGELSGQNSSLAVRRWAACRVVAEPF
jgi:hypothetical protein